MSASKPTPGVEVLVATSGHQECISSAHTCIGAFGSQAGMESVDVVQSVRISFDASSAPLEKICFTLPLHSAQSAWDVADKSLRQGSRVEIGEQECRHRGQ